MATHHTANHSFSTKGHILRVLILEFNLFRVFPSYRADKCLIPIEATFIIKQSSNCFSPIYQQSVINTLNAFTTKSSVSLSWNNLNVSSNDYFPIFKFTIIRLMYQRAFSKSCFLLFFCFARTIYLITFPSLKSRPQSSIAVITSIFPGL